MNQISRPTLLIDKARCVRNIQLMANKALRNGLIFRPHFKTHQSAEVAQWFRDAGVTKATVSSVSMAQYFTDHGWNDITIAFPINVLEIEEINRLADRITLNVLVESIEAASFLSRNLQSDVGIFLEIECGYGRSGLNPKAFGILDSILNEIGAVRLMKFKGLLSHAGHSYQARNKAEIEKIYRQSIEPLVALKAKLKHNFPDVMISYGDTPTASIVEDFSAIDEFRPGNFVYYDLTQWQISSCKIEDIAVAVACPVVSIHPERNEMIIYGGGVHFSKDRMELADGRVIYGLPVKHEGSGWGDPYPEGFLSKISQEHGTIAMRKEDLFKFKIGDIIKILPVHSCMTADLLKNHYAII